MLGTHIKTILGQVHMAASAPSLNLGQVHTAATAPGMPQKQPADPANPAIYKENTLLVIILGDSFFSSNFDFFRFVTMNEHKLEAVSFIKQILYEMCP